MRVIPGEFKIDPVLDVFVSEDQGIWCSGIKVSSPLHGYEKARQSSDFASEIEGTDTMSVNGINRSRPGSARRFGSAHRETDCVSS